MEGAVQPSRSRRIASVSIFALSAVAAMDWFFWSALQLVSQLLSKSPAVMFDKGAVYMLGVGLGLGLLTCVGLYEGILERSPTKRFGRWMNIGAIVSIGVMVVLPHMAHAAVNHYLVGTRGYMVCEAESHQWLLYRRIAYAASEVLCSRQ